MASRAWAGRPGKVHLAADRKCRPPAFVLTAGQAADSPRFVAVLEKAEVRGPVGRPRTSAGRGRRLLGPLLPKLQFRKYGSGVYSTVKTVYTASAGFLRTTTTVKAKGYWRGSYAGSTTVAYVSAADDCVALQ